MNFNYEEYVEIDDTVDTVYEKEELYRDLGLDNSNIFFERESYDGYNFLNDY